MSTDSAVAWLLAEKYHGQKTPAFYADCKRLALGEPLGYIIGWVPFLDTRIYLDSKPLIPRPETEYWTKEVLKTLTEQQTLALGLTPSEPIRVLDLCAGSGCIGVAIAAAVPHTHVTFAELDAAHLDTIARNCQENGIPADLYTIVQSNCFSALPDTTFDLIVSNPPYVDQSLGRVATSVSEHEPALALYGGANGLELITTIITAAPAHLQPGDALWLEHEPEQVAAIHDLAQHAGFQCTTYPDQYAVHRYSILVVR